MIEINSTLENNILNRIHSHHFQHIKEFFISSFENEAMCLRFLDSVFSCEPANLEIVFDPIINDMICVTKDRTAISDDVFIPRRMVNTVERLVLAARDMEKIRPGQDIFKIIFLITCAETLQILSGKDLPKIQSVFHFFESSTSKDDKSFIESHFSCSDEIPSSGTHFQYFIGVLNELRNGAAHEGDFWDTCFTKGSNSSLIFSVEIDFDGYTRKNHTTLKHN